MDLSRREVLGTGSLLATALAGCIGAASSLGQQNTTPTQSRNQSLSLSAEIIEVRSKYDEPRGERPTPPGGDKGNPRQAVTATFDCDNKTALLDGWLFTSSCRTIVVRSLSYNGSHDRATLVLFPKWNSSRPPEEVDCLGAKYNYQIRLTAQNTLPGKVRVVYEWPEGTAKEPAQFAITSDDC